MKQAAIVLLLLFCVLQIHCMDISSEYVVNLIDNGESMQLKALLECGYNPNTKYDGLTLLHCAAIVNNLGPLKVLFDDSRLDPNIESDQGKTALSFAINIQNLDAIQLFLKDSRVDINAQDSFEGATALHYAASLSNTTILEALLEDKRINPDICTSAIGVAPYHIAYARNSWPAFALLSPRTSFWVKHRFKIFATGVTLADACYFMARSCI